MIYKAVDNQTAAAAAKNLMEGQSGGLVLLFSSELAVVYGYPQYIDVNACIRSGAFLYQAWHLGGAIVCFPGDLSIMELKNGGSNFGCESISAVRDMLESRKISALIDGNDLMVDGRKCGSWARTSDRGYTQTVVHFSINSDVTTIRELCTKPMAKIPGALSDYGITAEDIWTILKEHTPLSSHTRST